MNEESQYQVNNNMCCYNTTDHVSAISIDLVNHVGEHNVMITDRSDGWSNKDWKVSPPSLVLDVSPLTTAQITDVCVSAPLDVCEVVQLLFAVAPNASLQTLEVL